MEAPIQDHHDHQDPLMEEGEVVVVADSQGVVMALEVEEETLVASLKHCCG